PSSSVPLTSRPLDPLHVIAPGWSRHGPCSSELGQEHFEQQHATHRDRERHPIAHLDTPFTPWPLSGPGYLMRMFCNEPSRPKACRSQMMTTMTTTTFKIRLILASI